MAKRHPPKRRLLEGARRALEARVRERSLTRTARELGSSPFTVGTAISGGALTEGVAMKLEQLVTHDSRRGDQTR